jgi:RNA polymerase sigma-70 factor (ECF subfamily)
MHAIERVRRRPSWDIHARLADRLLRVISGSVVYCCTAMRESSDQQVTAVVRAWRDGDQLALDRLIPLIDRPLRDLARRCIRARLHRPTLHTGSLVNETYLRLISAKRLNCKDRKHFFALTARIMRGILVDHARSRAATKRGEYAVSVALDENSIPDPQRSADLLALDDALITLSKVDPRKSQVIELRYFGGFSVEESADILGISPETVKRDWRLAKMWLFREVNRK